MMRMTLKTTLCVALLAMSASVGAQTSAPDNPPETIAIKAGRLIDVRGWPAVSNIVIVIEGERIVAVGSNTPVPDGAQVIDLSHATVLPGLIDCHTHIASAPGVAVELGRRSFVDAAIMAPTYARATLEAGFTTIRDLGAPSFVDVSLRNAIDRGDIPGPRIVAATMAIGATGGHSDVNGYSPYIRLNELSGVADGAGDIRKMIRYEVNHGGRTIQRHEAIQTTRWYTQSEFCHLLERAGFAETTVWRGYTSRRAEPSDAEFVCVGRRGET